MTVQRGILTPWNLPHSGRRFLVDDGGILPCYKDRWGEWICGHDHTPSVPLQDVYEVAQGWTVQS